jgi:type IV secretion system protein VirB8
MLEKIKGLFKGNKDEDRTNDSDPSGLNNSKNKAITQTWFEEQYNSIIVQRNILFLSLIVAVIIVLVSIIGISYVSTSKKFEPFVIQIQKDTGITTIVNPISSELLDGNDALARYFIKEYVSARETYNPVDFTMRARQIIRLMSTQDVYTQYLGYINQDQNNPSIIYGSTNTTYLQTKSWTKLPDGSFMYRFFVNETAGSKKTYNKIVTIKFIYKAMELTEAQRDINPVGFTVTGYTVNQDDS